MIVAQTKAIGEQQEEFREELQKLVMDMCAQEHERTQSMLACAKDCLQCESVSKADFAAEARRLWDAVKLDATKVQQLLVSADMQFSQASSWQPSSARLRTEPSPTRVVHPPQATVVQATMTTALAAAPQAS